MKKVLALVLCLALALSLSATALAEEVVFTRLYPSEVSTLNYLIATTQWDQTIPANVIDTLVEYDSHANVQPSLALSWENSEDGLTWTFKLREDVKWYDYQGNEMAPVTAHDFVASAKYVLTPEYESSLAKQMYVIKNAEEYYNRLVALNPSAPEEGNDEGEEAEETEEPTEPLPALDFAEVGVKALDDYTLEYTLERPVPYFLSALTYVNYMPAYGPLLEELGKEFGTANDKLYYCGSYILSVFEPQGQHVYTKNVNNWDADKVYIDTIHRIYNSEANTLAPTMALRGEVDYALINNVILEDWERDHPEYLSKGWASPDYSYFYCFNFFPTYGEEYGPENWRIAVNNSNFRHSIMSAFDRLYSMLALEPNDPGQLAQNTVTPRTFASADGVDYTQLPAFEGIEDNFFNADKALEYKAKAIEELTAAGVTFPVKMLLTYRSDDSDWENEYIYLKQQIEGVLGTDYIECVLYPGSTENFLTSTRRAGVYSFMRCNWGADYQDPETWAEPFNVKRSADTGEIVGNSYNKMDTLLESEDFPETRAILEAYYAAVEEARQEVSDQKTRYEKFAQAEAMLVNNAILVPYYISPADYQATKLNIYEGQFAFSGISILRYKGQKLYDDFISPEQQAEFKAAWEAEN